MFNIYCIVFTILATCKYEYKDLALHVFMPVTSSQVGLYLIIYPQKCT